MNRVLFRVGIPGPARFATRLRVIARNSGYVLYGLFPVLLPSIGHSQFVAALYLIAVVGKVLKLRNEERAETFSQSQLEVQHAILSNGFQILQSVGLAMALGWLVVIFFAPIMDPTWLLRIFAGTFVSFLLFATNLPDSVALWNASDIKRPDDAESR